MENSKYFIYWIGLSALLIAGSAAAFSVYGLATRMTMFALFPLIGIAQGFMPIAGYNYGAKNYKNYSLKILKSCKKKPISFEVFADEPEEMLKQAYKINQWGKNVYVKIPVVNSKGMFMGPVIKKLSKDKIFLNISNQRLKEGSKIK